MKPTFFADAAAFRHWLDQHAESAAELLVGFHKVATGEPCMSWSESVDEALCFGWIDGVRKRIDEATYTIRFTPRKATSIWSAINIAKVAKLQAEGRMRPPGMQAFEKRSAAKSAIYAYEQAESAELSADELLTFKDNKPAWSYFDKCPPGYRQQMLHRICSAKRPQTRAARLKRLIEASAESRRLE